MKTSVSEIKTVAYLHHTSSIVADEGLDVLSVSHFLPTGKLARCHICQIKQELKKAQTGKLQSYR